MILSRFAVAAVLASVSLPGPLSATSISLDSSPPPLAVNPIVQAAVLSGSDTVASDDFGTAIAASADGLTIVVSATSTASEGGATRPGGVYVFERPAGGWITGHETRKLVGVTGQTGDKFGRSVAISANGDTIVVGAQAANGGKGLAFVFVRPGTTWSGVGVKRSDATLFGADTAVGDEFGRAVAVNADGTTVVVGAQNAAAPGGQQGAVYVFSKHGTWVNAFHDAKLLSGGAAGDLLGSAVTVDASGATIVAGARGVGQSRGRAMIYVRPGGAWTGNVTPSAVLAPSDGEAGGQFGFSVALNAAGTVLAVGARTATVSGALGQGKLYVFEASAGWSSGTEQAQLVASDGVSGDHLGDGVSINRTGDVVFGAAPEAPGVPGPGPGAAYAFSRPAGGWTGTLGEFQRLEADVPAAGAKFGSGVAVSDDASLFAVGAAKALTGGKAYVSVAPSSTQTTVLSSLNPSHENEAVTLTASVTSASGIPTGTVTFDGVDPPSIVPLDLTGTAALQLSGLPVGAHQIRAVYNGDPGHLGSISAVLVQTVLTRDATTTTLSSSPNPSRDNQSVTLTASVTSASAGVTGTVTFLDGVVPLGPPSDVGPNGTATLQIQIGTVRTHLLSASYGGDAGHLGSKSATLEHRVIAGSGIPTTIGLTASTNPIDEGQPVEFTATVTSAGGAPSGEVTFGVWQFGAPPQYLVRSLDVSGHATVGFASLPAGLTFVDGIYSGNAVHQGSMANPTLMESVRRRATVILTAFPNPGTLGSRVQFIAVVPGGGLGTYTFFDRTTTIATNVQAVTGEAFFDTFDLSLGTHEITAVYSGDQNVTGGTSAPLSVAVVGISVESDVNPSRFGKRVTFRVSHATPTTATYEDTSVSPGDLHPVSIDDSGVGTFALDLDHGTHVIAVHDRLNGTSATTTQTVLAPVPLIHQPLVPSHVTPGIGAFALTINGFGFEPDSIVQWNGTARPTTFVSHSRLTASIAAADVAVRGTASVTVVTPAPGGGSSSPARFDISERATALVFSRSAIPVPLAPAVLSSNGLVARDVNHDAITDLITTTSFEGLGILLGRGDGTFQPRIDVSDTHLCASGVIALDDFNEDGHVDALEQACDGGLAVLLADGTGGLSWHGTVPVGLRLRALATGDFNGDGHVDVAAGHSSFVTILLGDGHGSFSAAPGPPLSGPQPNTLTVVDFDLNGTIDLLVNGMVFLGDGDGAFGSPRPLPAFDPLLSSAADLNGDGVLDVAGVFFSPVRVRQEVRAFSGPSFDSQDPAAALDLGEIVDLWSLKIEDVNGDGIPDIALGGGVGPLAGRVSIIGGLMGIGDGTFQPSVGLASTNSGLGDPTGLAFADFNGDGRLDFAAASSDAGAPALLIFLQTPTVVLSTTDIPFGELQAGLSRSQTLTISNTGSAPLHFDAGSFAITGAAAFSVAGNTCGAELLADHACDVTVTFGPLSNGPLSGTLRIVDDAADSPQSITLSGVGVVLPSAVPDGTLGVSGGTVMDTARGAAASVTVPRGALAGPTTVLIDVVPCVPAAGAIPPGYFSVVFSDCISVELTPTPAFPIPAPGITLVIPLPVHYAPGTTFVLSRLDPVTRRFVPSVDAHGFTNFGTVGADGMTATFPGVDHLSTFAALRALPTQGRMKGDGWLDAAGIRYSFAFEVTERASGAERGWLRLELTGLKNETRTKNDDRNHGPSHLAEFEATRIDDVVFSGHRPWWTNHGWQSGAGTVDFAGEGRWNGRPGYRFTAHGSDAPEWGHERDRIAITIKDPHGVVVANVAGTIARGAIEFGRLHR